MRKQLLSLFALLLMAAGGAVAQNANSVNAREFTRTPSGTWMLNQMPGWSGRLEVIFYEQYRLDSIPLTWTVMVAGVDKTADVTAYTAAEGPDTLGWLNVLEGDTVELVPPTVVKPNVKNVTLVDPSAPTATDLSTLTADYTAQDGEVLTGTLNGIYKITIADGATVTIDNLTINGVLAGEYDNEWAGLTCAGDATIILSGTNSLKGFNQNYPGIDVRSGKTLTIKGDGSLTASNNGNGAGIGGVYEFSCGNITIEGGNITATGGGGSAGIGGGGYGSCGNILITGGTINATGGTINATGGSDCPGIGGGRDGSCGTITITTGVTSVTATKGSGAPNSIGVANGYGSQSCGTITIGGTVYPNGITTSPYTYQP